VLDNLREDRGQIENGQFLTKSLVDAVDKRTGVVCDAREDELQKIDEHFPHPFFFFYGTYELVLGLEARAKVLQQV